jgi:hypothetical protein
MAGNLILPTSIAMSVVAFVLIAVWYVWPWMLKASPVQALTPILLFHSFRHIGLAFLVTGVTAAPLDARFAEPAAYGDLVAATLALAAVVALRQRWWFSLPLVWLFNVEGTLDLFNAVYQGFRHTPDGALGATYFIPAVIVPALLVTHALVFAWLLAYHRRRVPVGVLH